MDQMWTGEIISVEGKRSLLRANWHRPMNANGKAPAVVLTHGFGGNRHEARGMFVWLATMLSSAGIGALRMDCHGFGETVADPRTINIETMVDDVCSAVQHLHNEAWADSNRIALMGLSMGGLASACAVSTVPVQALCMWEAPFDPLLGLSRHTWPTSSAALHMRGGRFGIGGFDLGVQFVEALERLDVRRSVSLFHQPTLIVHGTADAVVPVETVRLWCNVLSPQPRVVLLPGADHGFTDPAHTLQAITHTVSFLHSTLCA